MELDASDPKQVAAEVFARTCSFRVASRRSGVPVKLIKEWYKEQEFQGMIMEVRTLRVMRTILALQRAAPIAVRVLTQELTCDETEATAQTTTPTEERLLDRVAQGEFRKEADPRKIRAAKTILEHFIKATEQGDLLLRITMLEEMMRARRTAFDVETIEALPTPQGET